jgi:hypothetical protein
LQDVIKSLEGHFSLTDEEPREVIGVARKYLRKTGLVEHSTCGKVLLSERGRQLLDQDLEMLGMEISRQFSSRHLAQFKCPICRKPTTCDPFTPQANGAAPTAKKFEECLRRCDDCCVGFSNSSLQDEKNVPLIHRDFSNNVPKEVRQNLSDTLQKAINEINRPSKQRSFCSENSEDAVTWTVFSYLAQSGKLRATLGSLGIKIAENATSEPILFLWGAPVFSNKPESKERFDTLIRIIDSIENCPRSRTEPDVILDFGDAGVVFIEVKFKSGNDSKAESYPGWSKYIDAHCSFFDPAKAKQSKMYELARNWRVGWDYADNRPFMLINLGPASLFGGDGRNLSVFAESLKQDSQHEFTKQSWTDFIKAITDKPDWFRRYDSDRGLSSGRLDLVRPIFEKMSLNDCAAILSNTQKFLANAAKSSLCELSDIKIESWGTSLKRFVVEIPCENRPYLIPGKIQHHNLIEVINQCATIERLVDALLWLSKEESGFCECEVVSCHPTTSSLKDRGNSQSDHDLFMQDAKGGFYYFEVSDVAGNKDGNNKEIKDLISLGAISGTVSSPSSSAVWPTARLFLICSSSFSTRICDTKRKVGVLSNIDYRSMAASDATCIVEVKKR